MLRSVARRASGIAASSTAASSASAAAAAAAGVRHVTGGNAVPFDSLDYVHRYLPHTGPDRRAMMQEVGVQSLEELFCDVPPDVLMSERMDLPPSATELEVQQHMAALASRNVSAEDAAFFVGGGLYRHHIPQVVDHLIQRSEFLTSYTPYQPEIAQGTLQALFEFQTQVAVLSGMEVSNASMYDGSTACGEAVNMAARCTRRKKVLLAGDLHPHYAQVVQTLASHSGAYAVHHSDADVEATGIGMQQLLDGIDKDTAAVVVQSPSVFGHVHNLEPIAAACKAAGALLISTVTEPVSLGALKSPGAQGADIFCGEAQPIGIPLNLGGPTAGLLACNKKHIRQMPGRIVGLTKDVDGRDAYVLTMAAREQHIRRDKATSNICTSAGLCALSFSIHLSMLGDTGLRSLALLNHARAGALADSLVAHVPSVRVVNSTFFNEFTLRLPDNVSASAVVDAMVEYNVLAGIPLSRLYSGSLDRLPDADRYLLVAATELTTDKDIDAFGDALASVLQ